MSDEFNQLRRVRTKELGNLLLISDFYILGSGPGPGSGSGSGLGTDLKNIHSLTVHHVSRKIVNAGFSFHSCQQTLRTFTRTKVTKIKIKLCGTFLMDQPTIYIHLWSFQKDLWAVSS